MSDIFFSTLSSNAMALVQVLLIALAGAILVRLKVFKSAEIKGLTLLVINVLLPSMIFSKIILTLDPTSFQFWWILPLVGIGLIFIGVLFAMLFFFSDLSAKKSLIPIASMQNAGYLALPLGQAIYPEQFDRYALYTFLIIMGLNPLLWSVGKFLNTGGRSIQISWKQFITPPFIANVLGITLVLSGLHRYIPKIVINAVELTGTATVPVANFILGAVLGGISLKIWPSFKDTIRVLGVKFFLIPLVTAMLMLALHTRQTNSLMSDVILIQAVSPPAIAILIQIKNYGGDEQKSGSLMLISYVFCIVAIPLWMAIWRVM
jgi:malate permease and related proteins